MGCNKGRAGKTPDNSWDVSKPITNANQPPSAAWTGIKALDVNRISSLTLYGNVQAALS